MRGVIGENAFLHAGGGVAQLGEHHVRNVGVEGSIPFSSTTFPFLTTNMHQGIEPASGADEQEDQRDARERVSQKPRRKSRWPGWPRLRRAIPFSSTTFPFLTTNMHQGIEPA